jgi:uncharacterized SAM-binding protein YcdF (DUF218 family)
MRFLRAVLGLGVLLAFTWGVLALSVFVFGRRDEARPADAIIVLGAAQYDGRPSPVLRARLDHAIQLYQRDIAPLLIVTGGVGVGDTVSEADVGRRYAVRAGIPAPAILTERLGLSSEQSMTTAAQLMRSRGLESAVLVSDPFHMLRLRLLAAQLGVRAFSSPTRSSPIVPGSREEWRFVLREALILPWVLLHDG